MNPFLLQMADIKWMLHNTGGRGQLRRGSHVTAHNNTLQGMALVGRVILITGYLVPRTATLGRPCCYHSNTAPQR
jgi:hypothetical protein